jgi:hypothetical protein
MLPSPILFLTSDAAERYATFEARELERCRMIAEAKRAAGSRADSAQPMRASVRHRLRSLDHLLAARRRGATGTGL